MEYYSTEKDNKALLAHEESHAIKTRDDKMTKPPLCQTLSVTSARNYARYEKTECTPRFNRRINRYGINMREISSS